MDNLGEKTFINTDFYTTNDSCYFLHSNRAKYYKRELTPCSAQVFKLSSFTSLLQMRKLKFREVDFLPRVMINNWPSSEF